MRRFVLFGSLASLIAIFAISACSDATAPEIVTVDSTNLQDDERLAWALATSLRDGELSAHLRNKLRESPFTLHRVRLQDMLSSADSKAMRESIANVMGITPEVLLDELNSRPPLDIWMPARAQRLAWRGAPGAVVRVVFDSSSREPRAFTSGGEALPNDVIDFKKLFLPTSPAVFTVAPSVGLAVRSRPQAPRPGLVVQEPDDGEIGGRSVVFFRNGDSVVTQLADMMQAAVDRAASQGKAQSGAALRMVPWSPASAVTTNKTYLKGLIIVRGEDFNSDTDPLELRWQAKQRRRSDNFVMLSQNTNMNMPNHISQLMELPLINAVQNSAGYIWLKLLEDDGSWGVDHYGEYTLQTESPNYLFKSWIEPYFGGGGDRCGAVTSEGNFSCPYPTSYGYYFWKEVNFNLQWQPWSPPPVALEISGPGSINPTEEVTWELQNITGSGTLSYDWWLDGTLVGSGPTFTTTIADPASTHWLSVDVYNGTGYWEHADMGILVNSGSCDPDDPDCLESLRIWPQ